MYYIISFSLLIASLIFSHKILKFHYNESFHYTIIDQIDLNLNYYKKIYLFVIISFIFWIFKLFDRILKIYFFKSDNDYLLLIKIIIQHGKSLIYPFIIILMIDREELFYYLKFKCLKKMLNRKDTYEEGSTILTIDDLKSNKSDGKVDYIIKE